MIYVAMSIQVITCCILIYRPELERSSLARVFFLLLVCVQVGYLLLPLALDMLGKPSNSPRGAEGATMARRVPFPPSSIPAYIEQSMKLFVCLLLPLALDMLFHSCVAKNIETQSLRVQVLNSRNDWYLYNPTFRAEQPFLCTTEGE